MKRSLPLLVAALLSTGSVWGQQQPTRYLIGFKPHVAAAQRELALDRLGAEPVEAFDELALVVADVPQAARVQALSGEELAGLQISYIEEDVVTNWLLGAEPSFQATPLPSWGQVRASIPSFKRSGAPVNALPPGIEAVEVPWGIRRVNAPAAWSVSEGQGVRVAVIDTGIDAGHPDLAGRVAGGYNAVDPAKPWFDDNVHGTHVSGTIAGNRDGRGVVGVAPKATLFAVKVLNAAGSGSISSIIKGLVWCARNDIQVANMSLGSPVGSVFLRLAIKYVSSKGVAIVAAAGNSGGSVGYPASYPETIAVSASDSQDQLAFFSSRGPRVDFVAPGVDVYSTEPGGRFGTHSGTSMATPHVTGLAALAVARGARGQAAVRAALAHAAHPIGLRPIEQGRGMIDAAEVVR
jgi:subtilisin